MVFTRGNGINHNLKIMNILQSIEDYRKCNFAEYLYEEATDVQQSSVSVSPTTTRAVDTWSVDLEEYDFEEVDWSPTDEDKIAFIVNNLSANNLREKVTVFSYCLKHVYSTHDETRSELEH